MKNKFASDSNFGRAELLLRLFTLLLLLTVAFLTGCATHGPARPTNPLAYQLGTASLVGIGLRNSPDTATYLRAVQPVACAFATGNDLSPAVVTAAIAKVTDGKTSEAVSLANGILALYILASDSVGGETNAVAARPYADAIFCQGLAAGLAIAPGSRSLRNQTATRWPLLELSRP